jgi:hypothetical protein
VRLGEGEAREIELAAGPPGAVSVKSDAAPNGYKAEAGSAPAQGTSRVPAYVALGVGGAGLAVGAVTGVMALNGAQTVRQECPAHQCTSPGGIDDASRTRTLSVVSTVGFGVGAVGAVIGTYLLLRAPSTTVSPGIGQGSGGLLVQGQF